LYCLFRVLFRFKQVIVLHSLDLPFVFYVQVTVTHYDASKKHGQLELIATPTHTETIIVTQQKQQLPASSTSVTTTTTTSASQLPVSPARLTPTKNLCNSSSNNSKLLIGLAPFLANSNSSSSGSTNSQLMLPHHNPHLYHSQEALNLFSSIGVPNYTESFAVDPNEILHKEKFIKSEPSTPTPTDFRPVFHNVRVPTKEDLLFKVEPMVTSSCQIKLETGIADPSVPITSSPPTASSHQLLMSPETEGISVNDIKKEVLSELFDCEPEYSSSDDSFLDGAYEDTTMHYSDDSQEDFAGCLLSSAGYDESSICQEGDGSAASGQNSNHNLDLSLKLEALSPMSSFDAEPVPQTPEFFANREDVFK
jgi:hypothetical protein